MTKEDRKDMVELIVTVLDTKAKKAKKPKETYWKKLIDTDRYSKVLDSRGIPHLYQYDSHLVTTKTLVTDICEISQLATISNNMGKNVKELMLRNLKVEPLDIRAKFNYTLIDELSDVWDEATANYIYSIPDYKLILRFVWGAITENFLRRVLVFVGDGSSGKTAAMLKMVQYPLTVKSMGLRSEYVIDGRNDMYDLPNSESACICVVSDKIKAVCNRDFEETLKSSTDKKRVVNIKSGEQIEAGAIGYLLITNFPFFISQENVKPLLQDRFIFVQFEPKNYTDNRDFLNKELDRNTYFSILERCTATPEESESSKALKADWSGKLAGFSGVYHPSKVGVFKWNGSRYEIN